MEKIMPFESYQQGEVVVVRLSDDMADRVNLERANFELHGIVEELVPPKIVLDFRDVTTVNSLLLGVIMGVNLKIRRREGRLHLCRLAASLQEVFHLVKLDRILDIHATVEDAVTAAAEG